MSRSSKRILAVLSISVGLLFLVFLLNQIIQFSASISQLSPVAGQIVLLISLAIFGIAVVLPLLLFMFMPAPLVPPKKSEGREYEKHLKQLSRRLAKNPNVPKGLPLNSPEEIEQAFSQLNDIADEKIKLYAKRAFYTTAISQNGALDALFMIALQFKLIWDVAHVYSQRPTINDMSFLYTNVMATALIASQLDEAEYLEMIESAINTGFGSAVSMIPGTALIVNSALSGASNTFLTLRVGIITQRYCNSLIRPERITLRNSATAAAAKKLGGIVTKGTYDLMKLIGSAPIRKTMDASKSIGNKFRDLWR
ncbi:MAG: DUF697 domain-containing protein [Balneolaceae bacterium]|nr:MAG: DUF697 domain-containing protein [Balneolaceae bacterium]